MMPSRSKHIVLVLFGGTGQRFGSPYPKQFADLGKEPMFVVTLNRFSASDAVDEIYVVVEPSTVETCRDLILSRQIKKIKAIVKGGSTRQESARFGLDFLAKQGVRNEDLVMIADGDRPNVGDKLILDNFLTAFELGSAVTAMPVTDSVLYEEEGKAAKYFDRKKIFLAQTPQTFRFGLIYKAHRKYAKTRVTDDASLLTLMHKKVPIVLGSKENLKITTPDDVEAYLKITAPKKETTS